MRLSLPLKLLGLTTIVFTTLLPCKSIQAVSFDEQEVDQSQFIAVAAPYRHGYNLMIVEQIPGQRKCWSENGVNPVFVDPLLLNFDFTDACKRSVDSNGYSVRLDGQDYGMDYLLNIVENNGQLQLVATHRDSDKPDLVIGTTRGQGSGSLKIFLNPGWRLTKRTYQDTKTEHVYLSGNSSVHGQYGKGCGVIGSAQQ